MTQGKLFSTTGRAPGTVPMFRMAVDPQRLSAVYVTCTRCGNTFKLLDRHAWASSSAGDTRPCPYCFKVSYIRKSTR